MFKFLKQIHEEWNKPSTPDPIKKGMKVKYLGVEWTVVLRFYIDATCSYFRLERINDLGQHESVNPPYFSELVTPVQKSVDS